MAKLSILAGSTSKLIDVFIQDTSSTTGAGLTGLVFNTASLTGYYYREGAASATSITFQTMTLGTWATGGFIVVDGTNMPGLYQVGIPNAAIASGAKSVVVYLKGATNMMPTLLEIELTAVDNQDATAYGLSRIDAAISSRMATFTTPTNFSTLSIDGSGRVDVAKIAGTAQTARDIGASVIAASVTAGVTVTTNNDKTAYTIASGGIGSGAHTAAEMNNISDAMLDRNMATGADSGTDSTVVRTVRQALRTCRNKISIAAGVMTVTKEDDTTACYTAAISTTAGNPISTVDPT